MVKFGTGGWRAIIGEEFTKEKYTEADLSHVPENEGRT